MHSCPQLSKLALQEQLSIPGHIPGSPGSVLTQHLHSQAEEPIFAWIEPSCAQWEGGREAVVGG